MFRNRITFKRFFTSVNLKPIQTQKIPMSNHLKYSAKWWIDISIIVILTNTQDLIQFHIYKRHEYHDISIYHQSYITWILIQMIIATNIHHFEFRWPYSQLVDHWQQNMLDQLWNTWEWKVHLWMVHGVLELLIS